MPRFFPGDGAREVRSGRSGFRPGSAATTLLREPQRRRSTSRACDIPDPLNEFRPRSVGASGTIAGLYARIDTERGVWKAPAGTEALLRGVSELDAPADGRGERRAQPARHQLPAHFPDLRDRQLGRPHPAMAPTRWRRSGSTSRSAASRFSSRRASSAARSGSSSSRTTSHLGPDPAQHRRLHANLFRQGAFQGQPRARRISSSATARPRPRTTSTTASSTSWSASRR